MTSRQIKVTSLRAGDTFLGNDEWHLTVEKVHVGQKRVTVHALNAWGEPMKQTFALWREVTLLRGQ